MSAEEKVGNICNPKENSFSFDWIIKDLGSLTKNVGTCLSSPTFAIYSAIWCCEIYPNGRYFTHKNSNGYVSVCLKLNTSLIPRCYDCKISVTILSGETTVVTREEQAKFDRNGKEHIFSNITNTSRLANEEITKIVFIVELIQSTLVDVSEFTVLKDTRRYHPETLSSNLKDIFLNQRYCDVTIKVNEKQFPAHKAILGARSPVFAAMFQHEMTENVSGEVNITDADPDVFHDILLYIYGGELENMAMTFDNVCQYYKLADKYDLEILKTSCRKFMECSMSQSNICDMLLLADAYNEINLKQLAIRYIVDNAGIIFQTSRWQKFRRDHQNLAFEILESGIMKKPLK